MCMLKQSIIPNFQLIHDFIQIQAALHHLIGFELISSFPSNAIFNMHMKARLKLILSIIPSFVRWVDWLWVWVTDDDDDGGKLE